jgi:hydroxymethylpyrimidine pyrophosphatase-like HAD family hydrolase
MNPVQIDKCKQFEIRYTIHDDVTQLKESVLKLTIDDESRVGGWQSMALPPIFKRRANAEFFKEYVHHQASKTSGLKKILDFYGVKPSEIMAIGDFYNDLDMIEYAGLGIAMGNAPDEVKQKADDVTLSNDEDGVYYGLEKHLYP